MSTQALRLMPPVTVLPWRMGLKEGGDEKLNVHSCSLGALVAHCATCLEQLLHAAGVSP